MHAQQPHSSLMPHACQHAAARCALRQRCFVNTLGLQYSKAVRLRQCRALQFQGRGVGGGENREFVELGAILPLLNMRKWVKFAHYVSLALKRAKFSVASVLLLVGCSLTISCQFSSLPVLHSRRMSLTSSLARAEHRAAACCDDGGGSRGGRWPGT